METSLELPSSASVAGVGFRVVFSDVPSGGYMPGLSTSVTRAGFSGGMVETSLDLPTSVSGA